MRQVLARRTVILHLRNMFNAFNGTDAQGIASIRNLVNSVLHREQRIREVQRMDGPNNSTSKQTSQLDTRRRKNICQLRTDGTETSCIEKSQLAIGWTEEYCKYLDLLRQLLSHTQLQGKSVKGMRTILLSASMVTDRSLDQ